MRNISSSLAPPRRTRRTALIHTELGAFSIHADTSEAAGDRAGLERLLRYGGHPPLSHKRLSLTASGTVCYRLRKPYYTGQTEVVLDPVAFLKRLATRVPPKRQNQVRYHGLLAAQAHDRDRLVALVPHTAVAHDGGDRITDGHDGHDGTNPTALPTASPSVRAGYRIAWARLLARVFEHDVLRCDHCGARRQVVAGITDLDVAAAILIHLGLPTEAPQLSPARAPPQLEMFGDDDHDG